MIPVFQTKFTVEDGDCMRACIASVLELPLDEIPNFTEAEGGERNMWDLLSAWLYERGLALLHLGGKTDWNFFLAQGSEVYGLGGVPSQKLKGIEHAVVVKAIRDGKWVRIEIAHDPRKDNDPYTHEDLIDTQWFVKIN